MTVQLINADVTLVKHEHLPAFDSLITDPPYSEHVHARMTSCKQHVDVKGVRPGDAGFGHLTPALRAWLAQAAGLARRWTVLYTDLQGTGAWETALEKHIRTMPVLRAGEEIEGGGVVGALPWLRWSMPQLTGDRPPSGCEMLVLGHAPGRLHWGGPSNLISLSHKCERGDEKHPAAKPLDQALDLVSWFTDPGETVFDPNAGRGTLGAACVLLGRNYFGFEIDPSECAKGCERIDNAQHSVLTKRDVERWHRWTASIGAEGLSVGVYPIKFKKGKPQCSL
jgi:hypothetical protein